MKAWMSWKEQEEDAALTRHEMNECGDLDAGCPHCKREYEARCKEVAEKAKAKMNELDAYLKAMEWLEKK